jgi:hypothetical protein
MNDQSRLLINAIRGPVILITIGVLFAADKMTDYRFGQTWPILLIVIGLLQLIGGRRRRADYYPPPASASSAAQAPPAPSSPYSSTAFSSTTSSAPMVQPEHESHEDAGEPRA